MTIFPQKKNFFMGIKKKINGFIYPNINLKFVITPSYYTIRDLNEDLKLLKYDDLMINAGTNLRERSMVTGTTL